VNVSNEEAARLVAEVAANGFWHHDMEVIPGVRTHGKYDPSSMLEMLLLPERLDGARVLDIGCSDGFFSFALEDRGADVTAVEAGPQTAGFKLTHRLRGSSVKMIESSVYELSPDDLGTFDIILFLGVIYHLRHPLLALDVLHRLAEPGAQLFVESHAIDQALVTHDGQMVTLGDPSYALMQFYPHGELMGDVTNWWAPTLSCLHQMIETACFRVEWGMLWNPARALVSAVYDTSLEQEYYPGVNIGDAAVYHPGGMAHDAAVYLPPSRAAVG
jgi:tRNA (mo5U34)-methyltransferase